MKYRDNTLSLEKVNAILEAYDQVLEDYSDIREDMGIGIICKQIEKRSAPKFFVSPERVLVIINNKIKNPTREFSRKEEDIYRCFRQIEGELGKDNIKNLTPFGIADMVSECPAPSFYLKSSSIQKIINKRLKGEL